MRTDSFTDKSYWLTTRDYTPGPGLEGDLDVDVAIVGAGFTGLSAAYFLKQAEPGLRIALLEAQVVGYGASGRNGGFSMTKIGMMHSITALRFGKARTVEAHEYAERAVDLVHGLVGDLGLDCDYEHPGFLWVATSEKLRQRLVKEAELVARLGIDSVELLDATDLAKRVSSPLYVGEAWYEHNCGILNPAKLAWAWKDNNAAAGIEVYENTPVSSVTATPAGHVLETPRGRVRAGKVVYAVNAWSHFFPELERKQVPVWTYIVLTEPLSDAQLGEIGWQHREGIEDFRDLVHYYRLTADNRIVFGGRDLGVSRGLDMDRDTDDSIFAKLRSDLLATFPQLEGVQFTHAWGGPVSAPLDLFPAIGHVGSPDAVYVLGCVGHGVSLSHLHGATVRDLVLERDTDLTQTFFVDRRVLPMPPEPLRHGLVEGIARFMRWEDRRNDVLPG